VSECVCVGAGMHTWSHRVIAQDQDLFETSSRPLRGARAPAVMGHASHVCVCAYIYGCVCGCVCMYTPAQPDHLLMQQQIRASLDLSPLKVALFRPQEFLPDFRFDVPQGPG